MKQLLYLAIPLLLLACNTDKTEKPVESQPSGSYQTIQDFVAKATKPDIKIQVEGLQGGGYSYLIGSFLGQNYKADSAQIDASGLIHFTADQPYYPGLFYVTLPDGSNFQMLVDLNQVFSVKTKLGDLYSSMKFEGSVDNDLLLQSMRFEESQRAAFQEISTQLQGLKPGTEQYRQVKAQQDKLFDERKAFLDGLFNAHPESLFTKFKRAGQNPDVRDAFRADGTIDTALYSYFFRTRFWNGVDFNDERLLYTPVISNKLKRYIDELTVQHPDSIINAAYFLVDKVLDKKEYYKYFANWIVINYDPKESTLMDAQAVFTKMVEKYFTYDRAFWSDSAEIYSLQLRAYEMSASLVGKKGPDVQAADPSGTMRSIYEMKSPYIIVYMWNPDCEHCAEQTPILVRNYNAWKSQGIDVYGIAVNTEDAQWRSSIKKYGMPWVNVFDSTNKSIYAKYYVDNTPEVYILDPDRTIIGKNLHVDQVMTIVDRDKQKRGIK
jgi:peroxiredoxin